MVEYIKNELHKDGVFYFSKLSEYENLLKLLIERLKIFGYDLKLESSNRLDVVKIGMNEVKIKVEMIEELTKVIRETESKMIDNEIVDSIFNKYENLNPACDKLIKILRSKKKSYNRAVLTEKITKENLNLTPLLSVLGELLAYIKIEKEVKASYLENNATTRKKFIYEVIEKELSEYEYHKSGNDIMLYDNKRIKVDEIKNLSDFIKKLTALRVAKEETLFFRGHPDFTYNLIPSIYRANWIYSENKIFHEMIIQHPEEFLNQNTTFEILTKMQHYELPTRLLDVTTNPLVAMFFACFDERVTTGEIVIFKVSNNDVKYYDSDTVSIISNICKVDTQFDIEKIQKRCGNNIDDFNMSNEVQQLIHEIKYEKSHFISKVNPKDLSKTIFVKSKFDNERIRRQRGAFILFGIGKDKFECAPMKNVYRKSGKEYRLLISEEAKSKMCKELKLLDIHYSSLFPEIMNAAATIKENYK